MHLIFIRHGDPDYKNDSLTQKGFKEADLLATYTADWDVSALYVSSYGRAQRTADGLEKNWKVERQTCTWLHEFDWRVIDPNSAKSRGAWDLMPEQFFCNDLYFNKDKWADTPLMQSGNIKEHYKEVTENFDKVLLSFGYCRKEEKIPLYSCTPNFTSQELSVDTHLDAFQKNGDERKLVFVCHLGVMFVLISYLTGLSPMQLWQGFFVAPTSVTILGAQERLPGQVLFRVQTMGSTSHLAAAKEDPSSSGFFGSVIPYA